MRNNDHFALFTLFAFQITKLRANHSMIVIRPGVKECGLKNVFRQAWVACELKVIDPLFLCYDLRQ